jgi:myo-inositol-1-phosphate synthase
MKAPSSYFMKSPPVQYTDDEARRLTEEFIKKYARKSAKPARKRNLVRK